MKRTRKKRYPDEYRRYAACAKHEEGKEVWRIQYNLKMMWPDLKVPDRKTIGRWVAEIYGEKICAAQDQIDHLSDYTRIDFAPTKLVSRFFQLRNPAKTSAIINATLEQVIKDKAMPEELYRRRDNDYLAELEEEEQEQQQTINNLQI